MEVEEEFNHRWTQINTDGTPQSRSTHELPEW
jgi:hypothetical protein